MEIAIVLGVVGAIVSAVWVASKSVSDTANISGEVNDLVLVSRNLLTVYQNGTLPGTGGVPVTPILIKNGVFPNYMLTSTSCTIGYTPCVKGRWGEDIIVRAFGGGNYFLYDMLQDQRLCIRIATTAFQTNGQTTDPGAFYSSSLASGATTLWDATLATPVDVTTIPGKVPTNCGGLAFNIKAR